MDLVIKQIARGMYQNNLANSLLTPRYQELSWNFDPWSQNWFSNFKSPPICNIIPNWLNK